MSLNPQKFFLTTPIYYVNARPHIGHAYTTIVADVLARRHRLLGEDTFFLTGTDEHGQKIERSAAAAGIPPQEFTDRVSQEFRSLWDRMGLTYDKFIRTTDPDHKRGAQKLFRELYDRGYIYLSTYTGSYCVSDEAFVDLPAGTPCPDCGRTLETVTEENFFFELSQFQERLIDLIDRGDDGGLTIEPLAARNEVLSFLTGNVTTFVRENAEKLRSISGRPLEDTEAVGLALDKGLLKATNSQRIYVPGVLNDLSVSRSSFTWGIPVPDDIQQTAGTSQNHVIYVWLDALANYITAIDYGSEAPEAQAEFQRYWPADLHLVGKEITRFHCVYWPAFLLAVGLEVPKRITANGWLLFDNAKMSKSRGNVVRTETILDAFGTLCPPVHLTAGTDGKGTASAVPLLEAGNAALAAELSPPTPHERDLFASDVLRYFLLREIPFGQDGSFSFDALVTRYNADLANGYGNLVSRVLKLISSSFSGLVPEPTKLPALVGLTELGKDVLEVCGLIAKGMSFELSGQLFPLEEEWCWIRPDGVLRGINSQIARVDSFLAHSKPWVLAKSDDVSAPVALSNSLYTAAESIRIITALLYPILPFATAKVWTQLGLGDIEAAAHSGELNNLEWGGLRPGTKLGPLTPIFPRADKGLAQIMADMEEARAAIPQTSHPSHLIPEQNPPQNSPNSPLTTEPNTPSSLDPAAPPRTGALDSLDEPSGTLTVGGSSAVKPTLPPPPRPPPEAPAPGAFASAASQVPANAAPEDASAQIGIDDFMRVELRVAQILVAERIPKADKLLRLEVDLGYERRQILSGIAQWYAPEDLIGRRIVIVANLAPRKMRGLESHGMLLAASEGADGKPVLATFGEEIALGSRVR